jgi:hypothetical protein
MFAFRSFGSVVANCGVGSEARLERIELNYEDSSDLVDRLIALYRVLLGLLQIIFNMLRFGYRIITNHPRCRLPNLNTLQIKV